MNVHLYTDNQVDRQARVLHALTPCSQQDKQLRKSACSVFCALTFLTYSLSLQSLHEFSRNPTASKRSVFCLFGLHTCSLSLQGLHFSSRKTPPKRANTYLKYGPQKLGQSFDGCRISAGTYLELFQINPNSPEQRFCSTPSCDFSIPCGCWRTAACLSLGRGQSEPGPGLTV